MKSLRQIIKEELDDWSWADKVPPRGEYVTNETINYVRVGQKFYFTQNNDEIQIKNTPVTVVEVGRSRTNDEYNDCLVIHFDDPTVKHGHRAKNEELDQVPKGCEDHKCWYVFYDTLDTQKLKYI